MDLESSLLQSLHLDRPCLPPKTWDSIPSESAGGAAPHSSTTDNLSTISEPLLVRLLLNALHGIKSALHELAHLSAILSATPADRTARCIPTLWCRSSSTAALGNMLSSVARSGVLVFFLRCFANHYLSPKLSKDKKASEMPPYSLVNQAFAVAVGKVLEGYFCALETLSASVRLRRKNGDGAGDVTILEVYLHTKELRTHIEALANVCLPEVAGFASRGVELSVDSEMEFDKFPRGVELLTYLYVQLRDADPVHCALLKFLFVRSCEPYCAFIKSWIYRAVTDDPFEEFFILHSDDSPTSNCAAGSVDYFSLAHIKERDCISVPCFLKEYCCPLVRAGQQLQVLVKLLNLCNSAVIGSHIPCNLTNIVDILPFWPGMSGDSVFLLNPISFSRKDIEAMLHERETMYQSLLEKLRSFFTNLNVGFQRMNQNSMASKRKGANLLSSLVFDVDLNFSSSGHELDITNLDADHQDTDSSSTTEESIYEVERASDSSSVYSSGEEVEAQGISGLHATWYTNKSILERFSTSKNIFPQRHSRITGECLGPSVPAANHSLENVSLNEISLHQSGDTECLGISDTECFRKSKTLDGVFQSHKCWPLGGLMKNPFYADMKYRDPNQLHLTGCSIRLTDRNTEALDGEELYSGETLIPFNCELDPVRRVQIMNGTHKSLSSCIHQPCDTHNYYDLSTNPILAKPAWLRTVRNSRDRSSINNNGSFFRYFDFSSVEDPYNAYSENIVNGPIHGSQFGAPVPHDTGPSAVEANTISSGCVGDNIDPQSVLSSICSSRKENSLSGEGSLNVSGGADWEGSLKYSGVGVAFTTRDTCHGLGAMFEIPLDIIIHKCIVQEILLQYKYISTFTIKLLEEGFDLREHLLALRRYHFMELADWADSFIISLCNKKWLIIEPDQKIAEIQGLLDLALQRSSCENDHYKERLFVLKKGDGMMHQSISSTGIHAFDFIMLGYRVDWPVSIIVSQDALTIYAEIFSYLIQVRLAIFSLSDAWNSLKAVRHSACHSRQMGSSKLKDFNILMKIRQQINHFVSTLQQYVHSQLSDVSWCRFQHSLKHQVKDMLDLESVHTRYLTDALHICFLSVETKAIATIIRNILQCALDFRSCLYGSRFDFGSDGVDVSNLRSQINFSQVFTVKSTFEKNVKDLYLLYLRSPKHGESSICRFWSYLNFNDYYSIAISKEMDYFYL